MTTSEKVRMAEVGNAAARAILVREPRRLVAMAAVRNMNEAEAAQAATSKEVAVDVLRFIGFKKEWLSHYEIKRSLVFNPRTPTGIALRFIQHMREHDLKGPRSEPERADADQDGGEPAMAAEASRAQVTLLKRLLGGRSAEEERALGQKLLGEGDAGGAKLAFERALQKAKDPAPPFTDEVKKGIRTARDAIAASRLGEARRYLESGDISLARTELEGALEVVSGEKLRAEAQNLVDGLERSDAIARAAPVAASADEILAAMAGSWEEAQADEYDTLGEPLERALLALHDRDARRALEHLNQLLDEAEEPRYLWYEVGRAHFELEEPTGAEIEEGADALRTFLECLDEHEGGDARLVAHLLLARLADRQGEVDDAVGELEAAAAALDNDPRPYKELGAYLRSKGRGAEAVEVLELALQGSEDTPDWAFITELGLAYEAAGKRAAAIETLEGVLQTLAAQRRLDFPPVTALPLARIHEEEGNLERAADLFRTLCEGSDRENHASYHYEAGRLLRKLELDDEARRMLKRAQALAADLSERLEQSLSSEDAGAEKHELLREASGQVSSLREKIREELEGVGDE